jgi:hypothetical protein
MAAAATTAMMIQTIVISAFLVGESKPDSGSATQFLRYPSRGISPPPKTRAER